MRYIDTARQYYGVSNYAEVKKMQTVGSQPKVEPCYNRALSGFLVGGTVRVPAAEGSNVVFEIRAPQSFIGRIIVAIACKFSSHARAVLAQRNEENTAAVRHIRQRLSELYGGAGQYCIGERIASVCNLDERTTLTPQRIINAVQLADRMVKAGITGREAEQAIFNIPGLANRLRQGQRLMSGDLKIEDAIPLTECPVAVHSARIIDARQQDFSKRVSRAAFQHSFERLSQAGNPEHTRSKREAADIVAMLYREAAAEMPPAVAGISDPAQPAASVTPCALAEVVSGINAEYWQGQRVMTIFYLLDELPKEARHELVKLLGRGYWSKFSSGYWSKSGEFSEGETRAEALCLRNQPAAWWNRQEARLIADLSYCAWSPNARAELRKSISALEPAWFEGQDANGLIAILNSLGQHNEEGTTEAIAFCQSIVRFDPSQSISNRDWLQRNSAEQLYDLSEYLTANEAEKYFQNLGRLSREWYLRQNPVSVANIFNSLPLSPSLTPGRQPDAASIFMLSSEMLDNGSNEWLAGVWGRLGPDKLPEIMRPVTPEWIAVPANFMRATEILSKLPPGCQARQMLARIITENVDQLLRNNPLPTVLCAVELLPQSNMLQAIGKLTTEMLEGVEPPGELLAFASRLPTEPMMMVVSKLGQEWWSKRTPEDLIKFLGGASGCYQDRADFLVALLKLHRYVWGSQRPVQTQPAALLQKLAEILPPGNAALVKAQEIFQVQIPEDETDRRKLLDATSYLVGAMLKAIKKALEGQPPNNGEARDEMKRFDVAYLKFMAEQRDATTKRMAIRVYSAARVVAGVNHDRASEAANRYIIKNYADSRQYSCLAAASSFLLNEGGVDVEVINRFTESVVESNL